MIKKLYIICLCVAACVGFASCDKDEPSDKSIFSTENVSRDAFDEWILQNYTYPYNVAFKYRMEDIESDMSYNLVPADSAKSAKLAMMIKYMWFDVYSEVAGQDFLKTYVPKIIHLIGSLAYNAEGTVVMGSAEGGLKVTLYGVNDLTDDRIKDYATLNEYYFHTMHHEFTHIFNQTKPYNTAFDQITEADYVSGNWYLLDDETDARPAGFVTAYAMMEGKEDFAETLSTYVTSSKTEWEDLLIQAGTTGKPLIEQKIDYVRSYMAESWGIDIDDIRDAVLRRGNEINQIDLSHLH